MDEADLRLALADADAEKLAVPALVARARDAGFLQVRQLARSARPGAAAVLCRPDAVQSAEQSCAAPEAAADPKRLAQPDAAPLESVPRLML